MDIVEQQVRDKYPNYYWGERYQTYEIFQRTVLDVNPRFYVMAEWVEFGVKLVDLCDGDMHGEIVIINEVYMPV